MRINLKEVRDAASFHRAFAEVMGFPAFYGCNMDAWIDCMSDLDENSGMTEVRVRKGEVLVLELDEAGDFSHRCPNLFRDLVDCCAFVNWRRIKQGNSAILVLAYARNG